MLNLELGWFYRIVPWPYGNARDYLVSGKSIHDEYRHTYFCVSNSSLSKSEIHNSGIYLWDAGVANRGGVSRPYHNHIDCIQECRELTHKEILDFIMSLNDKREAIKCLLERLAR